MTLIPARSLLITGPTGVGKSDVAMRLAEHMSGEIITVDSMQAYRGLDVGTAKPSAADQARVPHHLLNVASLTESFDAARFLALATKAAGEIESRGGTPVFCGGTGLYFKALLEGVGSGPPSDPAVRAALETLPIDALLREIEEKDPDLFGRIDKQNPRRLVRALEVIRLTGQPFSSQRAEWGAGASPCAGRFFVLHRDPQDQRARLDRRVDRMMEQGWIAETSRLLESGLASNRTAMQAIGYRQLVEHLQGERGLDETVALIKTRTRQFAKRQLTWFKHQADAVWIKMEPAETAEAVTGRILELCGGVG